MLSFARHASRKLGIPRSLPKVVVSPSSPEVFFATSHFKRCLAATSTHQNLKASSWQFGVKPNMWEPKLPRALLSGRGIFGSHMLVFPKTTFLIFWVRGERFLCVWRYMRHGSWSTQVTLESSPLGASSNPLLWVAALSPML